MRSQFIGVFATVAAAAMASALMAADAAEVGVKEGAADTAKAEAEGEVSAIVNGDIKIMKADVDMAEGLYRKQMAQRGMDPNDGPSKVELRNGIIEELAMEKVLQKMAKDGGFTISDEELDEFANSGNMPPLEQIAKNAELPVEKVKEQLRNQLTISKMMEDIVSKVAEPTDDEIAETFNEAVKANPSLAKIEPSVAARHILIKVDDGASEAVQKAAKDKLEGIRKQIVEGADFAKLAEEFSDCPSGKRSGGDLGEFGRGQMVPEFENVAFTADVGKVSEVFKTKFGYHILEVTGKTEGGVRTVESEREEIAGFLKRRKSSEAARDLIGKVRDEMKIDILEKLPEEEPGEEGPVEEEPAARPLPKWAD